MACWSSRTASSRTSATSPRSRRRHADLPVTHLEDRLILPGFIDGHIHFPQVRVLGAYGNQLLDWLQTWIFPEELKYRDRSYARAAAGHFFDALLAGGTTTCQAFTTSSPVSTEEFFDEAARRGMRVIAGLTGIDRFAPDDFLITPDDFYRESKRLIERYHRKGRNLYAITPRFAGRLHRRDDGALPAAEARAPGLLDQHPHLREPLRSAHRRAPTSRIATTTRRSTPSTACWARNSLPGTASGSPTTSSAASRRRGRPSPSARCRTCSWAAACSASAGPLDPEYPVRVALGCDMGGGNAFSIIRVLEEAYKVGMCNNTMLDGSVNPRDQDLAEAERNKLSPYRAFYLATLGGARALYLDDLLGNFDKGKEADFVALDWNAGQAAMRWHQSLIVDGSPRDDGSGGAAALRRHDGRRRPQRRRNLDRRQAGVQEDDVNASDRNAQGLS